MPHPSALDADTKRRIDEILSRSTLARLATASPRTLQPHVVPVWFCWDGECLWISGFRSTRKFKELRLNPRCAVVVGAAVRLLRSSRPTGEQSRPARRESPDR